MSANAKMTLVQNYARSWCFDMLANTSEQEKHFAPKKSRKFKPSRYDAWHV